MTYKTGTWGVQAKIRHKKRYSNKENVLKRRDNEREFYKQLKQNVFIKLGNKCNKCGFNDIRALQIDHINGKGNIERKSMTNRNFYRIVLKDISGKYQILCANCNWIKRWENKEGNIPMEEI